MNKEIDKVGPLFGAYLDWVEGNKTVAIGDLIVSRDQKLRNKGMIVRLLEITLKMNGAFILFLFVANKMI